MALGTTKKADITQDHRQHVVYPSDYGCRWDAVCTAPHVAESGDAVSGGKVVKPGAIDRAEQRMYRPQGMGNRLLVALRYSPDVGTVTSPVVKIFGQDRDGGVWHVLRAEDGSVLHTLSVDTANDVVQDDGYAVTNPVEVLLDGSVNVIVAVETAFDAASGTKDNASIIVKTVSAR